MAAFGLGFTREGTSLAERYRDLP